MLSLANLDVRYSAKFTCNLISDERRIETETAFKDLRVLHQESWGDG